MASRILHPLFHLIASLTQQELARQIAYLQTENRILRERLPERIVTTPAERNKLIRAGRQLGTQLKDLMSIVTYQTFLRWIRETEQQHLTSRKQTSTGNGRPRTAEEICQLIVKIRLETSYGYTKIRQELTKLGVRISRQTVKNVLVEAGYDVDPGGKADSWDAFLKRHAATLWQCDYLTKPMWTKQGIVDLFVIVFIHLGTRRIWLSPSTASPTASWTQQQARNFLLAAEDAELPAEILIHDRDQKFRPAFDEVIRSSGCQVKLTPIQSPNLQAHVERAVQTMKHEVLNHFVIVSEKHLNHICREAQDWYNHERGHSARGNLPPSWVAAPEAGHTIRLRDVGCSTRLGGLLKHYWRRAA